MKTGIMDLSLFQLSLAYIFVLLLLLLSKVRGIGREKLILLATTRMSIQLTAMGFVLIFIFQHPSWWLTLLTIAVMLSFAVYNAVKRLKLPAGRSLQ